MEIVDLDKEEKPKESKKLPGHLKLYKSNSAGNFLYADGTEFFGTYGDCDIEGDFFEGCFFVEPCVDRIEKFTKNNQVFLRFVRKQKTK